MSGRYSSFRDALATGQFSWISDTLAAQLVSDRFSFDEDDADIQKVSGLLGDPIFLTNPTVDAGWCSCDTIFFKNLTDGKATGVLFFRADGLLVVHHDAIDNFPMPTSAGRTIEMEISKPGIFRT